MRVSSASTFVRYHRAKEGSCKFLKYPEAFQALICIIIARMDNFRDMNAHSGSHTEVRHRKVNEHIFAKPLYKEKIHVCVLVYIAHDLRLSD